MIEPLHVRVARALGWTHIHQAGYGHEIGSPCGDILLPGIRYHGRAPGNLLIEEQAKHEPLPPYGKESPEGWACTGPLLSRYEVTVDKREAGWCASAWRESMFTHEVDPVFAATSTEAIALLVCALHEAGRLPR
jgi:hypothetical protein